MTAGCLLLTPNYACGMPAHWLNLAKFKIGAHFHVEVPQYFSKYD